MISRLVVVATGSILDYKSEEGIMLRFREKLLNWLTAGVTEPQPLRRRLESGATCRRDPHSCQHQRQEPESMNIMYYCYLGIDDNQKPSRGCLLFPRKYIYTRMTRTDNFLPHMQLRVRIVADALQSIDSLTST